MKFTEVYKKVPEGYIGFVEELPGANTQGRTLEANRLLAEESILKSLLNTYRPSGA